MEGEVTDRSVFLNGMQRHQSASHNRTLGQVGSFRERTSLFDIRSPVEDNHSFRTELFTNPVLCSSKEANASRRSGSGSRVERWVDMRVTKAKVTQSKRGSVQDFARKE